MKADNSSKMPTAQRGKTHSTEGCSNAEVNWIKHDGIFEPLGIEWTKLIIVAMVCTT